MPGKPLTPQELRQRLAFDRDGLIPCVVQDHTSGEVLMVGYGNEPSIRMTLETGELHLWSRKRQELWHKGLTSGNIMKVRAVRVDCDWDTLLIMVEPAGPACHTGERTCFHNGQVDVEVPAETLARLERTVAQRKADRPDGSYTVELLDDPRRIGEKVMEEAEEVARAAAQESDVRVDEEAADVLYHLTVLLASRGRTLADAEEVLISRSTGGRG